MTGYDVQSTVILELMLLAFEERPGALRIRPEGHDDLELRWADPNTGQPRCRYHQIKKATDNDPEAEWSLAHVARVLLGKTVANLKGNHDEQVWVLGDRVAAEVQELLAAGRNAPHQQRSSYLAALHRLSKAEAQVTEGLNNANLKHRLDRWNPTSSCGPIDQVRAISPVQWFFWPDDVATPFLLADHERTEVLTGP